MSLWSFSFLPFFEFGFPSHASTVGWCLDDVAVPLTILSVDKLVAFGLAHFCGVRRFLFPARVVHELVFSGHFYEGRARGVV